MRYWAAKQGISLDKVTSFTDGTKVQIEQVLVANGLGAGITQSGLTGVPADDVSSGAAILAAKATSLGYPISDFILSPRSPAGVFIVAEHDERFREYLRYYKMGDGPYYTLLRNYHLCNLEIIKTLKRVQNGGEVLLNNGLRRRLASPQSRSDPSSPEIEFLGVLEVLIHMVSPPESVTFLIIFPLACYLMPSYGSISSPVL